MNSSDSRNATVENKLLKSTVSGSGPNLVFLHGWGTNSAVWRSVSAALVKHFCVVNIDLPGYKKNAGFPADSLIDHVKAIARSTPPQTAVCAWSLGGQIALRWACDFPTQVSRLILVGTTAKFCNGPGWEQGSNQDEFHSFAAQLEYAPVKILKTFFSLVALGDVNTKRIANILKTFMSSSDAPNFSVLQRGLDLLATTDVRAIVSKVKQSSLLIHGANDRVCPIAAAQWLARAMPKASLHTFDDCGHAPFLSQPNNFVAIVKEYLLNE